MWNGGPWVAGRGGGPNSFKEELGSATRARPVNLVQRLSAALFGKGAKRAQIVTKKHRKHAWPPFCENPVFTHCARKKGNQTNLSPQACVAAKP